MTAENLHLYAEISKGCTKRPEKPFCIVEFLRLSEADSHLIQNGNAHRLWLKHMVGRSNSSMTFDLRSLFVQPLGQVRRFLRAFRFERRRGHFLTPKTRLNTYKNIPKRGGCVAKIFKLIKMKAYFIRVTSKAGRRFASSTFKFTYVANASKIMMSLKIFATQPPRVEVSNDE